MSNRRMTDLSRRSFTLGMTTLALAAPAIVRAQDLTKVKITQPVGKPQLHADLCRTRP